MEYQHYHTKDVKLSNAFKTGIIINIIFILFEGTAGYFSNSMALIADAGHNFSDVLSLILSWAAVILSMKEPTLKYTYGFRRSAIFAALLNTLLLLLAVAIIIFETVRRINQPLDVKAEGVIIVAAAGIIVNAFTAWLFHKDKQNDINIRSAFVHFVADALVSFGVVISGVLMILTHIQWIDAAVSFAVVAVILHSSYKLLVDTVNLALDAVPRDVKIESVRDYLASLPNVTDVHDLHIWSLGTSATALTVHLMTIEATDVSFITKIQRDLNDKFKIEHSTIQIEFFRE